jgi:hypothetical protein
VRYKEMPATAATAAAAAAAAAAETATTERAAAAAAAAAASAAAASAGAQFTTEWPHVRNASALLTFIVCSLHSADANLTIDMRLRSLQPYTAPKPATSQKADAH